MTVKEQVLYLLRKYPEIKFNRANFFWRYFEEFCEAKFYLTKEQWKEAYPNFESLGRVLRDLLKTDEFKLKPEQDTQRYKKASQFQQEYKTSS